MSRAPAPLAAENGDGSGSLRDSSLLGSDAPNSAYLGARLQYEHGAETFDVARMVQAASGTQRGMALLYAVFPGLVGAFIVYRVLGAVITGLYLIALACACGFLWIAPLWRRHSFVVSEWKLTLEGKGGHAEQVFEHIADAILRRDIPVEYRVLTLPLTGSGQYLNVRLGLYDGYVSCMAFGSDLYIGWTLWCGATYWEVRDQKQGALKTFLLLPYYTWLDVKLSRERRGVDIGLVHQNDVIKALRETLHSVTREGVQAAVGVVPFRGEGTIGSRIPTGPAPQPAGSAPRR